MSSRYIPQPPLPRCCPSHPEWPTLCSHLAADFPQVQSTAVARELHEARTAVEWLIASDPEALYIGELIARNQLLLLTGERVDRAHLDPQSHIRQLPVELAS